MVTPPPFATHLSHSLNTQRPTQYTRLYRSLRLLSLGLFSAATVIASHAVTGQTQAPAAQLTAAEPAVRIPLKTLLAPTDTAPLAGNASTEPNALGQYSVYAIEHKEQELMASLRAGNYQGIGVVIDKLRSERTQTTGGMSAATLLVNNLAEREDIEPLLRQWLEAEPQAQVGLLLYGAWCIEEAWRQRGSDWASNVSKEGWQGFEKYLTQATNTFAKALELDPTDYISAQEMITVSLGLGGLVERHAWFTRATATYPDYYEAYSAFQYSLRPRWGGMRGQMRLFATQNAGRGPQFPLLVFNWIHNEEDEAYKTKGSPLADQAWKILQEYSTAFPDSGSAYCDMAVMQMNFKNNQEAMQYAQKAVKLDPSARNRYIYARTLHTQRENEQSIAELKAALTLSPNNPRYWDWLGRNYFTVKARNLPLAIECFTRAIELGDSSQWLPVDRGRSYMILGNVKAAIPDFEYATKRWPNFDQAYYNLGMALYRDGDQEGAQRAFDRAIALNERNKAGIERFLSQQKR